MDKDTKIQENNEESHSANSPSHKATEGHGASRDELKKLEIKCEEYLNGWKRERADFLNYKKDEMERIGNLAKYANEEIILKLLPILDNFYLAEKHISEDNKVTEGFIQIKKQLEVLLEKEGVKPLKSLYEKFDSNVMEVVEEIPVRDVPHNDKGWQIEEPGIAVEIVQRGYMLHDRVIRVAKVKVSK